MSLASIDETLLQENTLRAFEELRFEDAVRMLEPMAWSRPDPELLNNLGALYFQLNWAREAEAAFQQAMKLDPGHPTAVLNLAEQYIHYNLPFAALKVLEDAQARTGNRMWAAEIADLKRQLTTRRVAICLTPGRPFDSRSDSHNGSRSDSQIPIDPTDLAALLQHLQALSYPLHELLVQDGTPLANALRTHFASTQLPTYLRFLPHSELPGRHTFPNTALKRCTSEYFLHLELDQLPDFTWLERTMAHMENPEVGAVGARVLSSHPNGLIERWMQAAINREHGPKQLENPPFLGEPGCVFRVSAVKRIGGWNARWNALNEELDRTSRLNEAGFVVRYEPSALVRRAGSPSLEAALREVWQLRCLNRMEAQVYERLDRTAACINQNATMALKSIAVFLSTDRIDLLYPSFLQNYAWAVFDLEQTHARGQIETATLSQTCTALLLVTRHVLRNALNIPARVVERTLADLHGLMTTALRPEEQRFLREDAPNLETLPDHVLDLDALLEALGQLLPFAAHFYVKALVEQRFLGGLGNGMGVLLEKSVERLDHEQATAARLQEQHLQGQRPHYVLYNPPGNAGTMSGVKDLGGQIRPGAPAVRWTAPSRLERLAEQCEAAGAVVTQLDAVALSLDGRLAEARLLGMNPDVIVYSGQEGGIERMVATARRLKLIGPPHLRQILVHAGPLADLPIRRSYAMFDEIYRETLPRIERDA